MRGGFEQVINLNLKRFDPEVARQKHIEIAKKGLNAFLANQKTKPSYRIIVDESLAASENQVKPFGIITYVFLRMSQVGIFAIQTARDLSPVQSGRYRKSWMILIDGKLVSETLVPDDVKEIILVNNQPYARKIQVRGARIVGVPPGIVEKIKQLVLRQFRNSIVASVGYIELRNAYVLKKDYIQIRRSGRRRLHTKAGSELTYPALIMTPKYG